MPGIVLDTNALVSAFVAPSADATPRRALILARRDWTICISMEMEDELRGVLLRPRFRRYGATPDTVEVFLSTLLTRARRVQPTERISDCRDLKDNMFLEAVLAGQAGALVSGDADLLALHPWCGIPILSPSGFVATFGAG